MRDRRGHERDPADRDLEGSGREARLNRVRWVLLLGGALALRLLLFVGPQGSDDVNYSDRAQEVASGTWQPKANIFHLRIGYIGTIGLLYRVFGAGPFVLVAFNLACSIAGIALARLVALRFLDDAGAWTAAILVAVLPLDIHYATEAHPDLPVATLTALAVLFFLQERFLAAGLALGLAHYFKETAFLGFLALVALDRPKPRHAGCVAGFAAMLAIEAIAYWIATGDPFYRLTSTWGHQAGAMGDDYYSRSVPTLRRVFVDVPAMLFWPASSGFPYFFLLPALAVAGCILARKGLLRVALWAAAIVLVLNFWPIQLVPYRPATVAHARGFFGAALPMAILAAFAVRRIPKPWIAAAAFGVLAFPAAFQLRDEARTLSAGARLAFEHLPPGSRVASDPRTARILRLLDGYRGTRTWIPWSDPAPAGPFLRVDHPAWTGRLRDWYGETPPAWYSAPGRTRNEFEVPGRFRIRALRRLPPFRVRIDEVDSSVVPGDRPR